MFNQYILILVWIGFCALIQPSFYREEYNELTGEYDWHVSAGFAFVVMLPVIWMAANRGFFADTTAYILSYRDMPTEFSMIPEYIMSIKKDKGFFVLSCVLRVLFGYNHMPYLFSVALLQALALITLFRKYSVNFIFSVFLFIASTDYISWMFNGMRQFVAVALILLATPFMLKKKWIQLVLIILLASTMHQSALLMFPIVFIAQGKAWNKKTLLFIGMMLLVVLYINEFTDWMDEALQTTQYANVVSDYTEWNDDGTNPLRVAVYSIPAIISFFNRKKIQEYDNELINFCTNMSIISMGIYVISMYTSGIFIGRLPIYASLYSYVLLPWELEFLFSDELKNIAKGATIIGYIVLYFILMKFQNGLI